MFSDGYSYRTDINDLLTDKINAMFEFSCGQLCQCLVNLLGKLARYDKHSIFSPLLMLVDFFSTWILHPEAHNQIQNVTY